MQNKKPSQDPVTIHKPRAETASHIAQFSIHARLISSASVYDDWYLFVVHHSSCDGAKIHPASTRPTKDERPV